VIRRNEISRLAGAAGVPEKTIEKDYVITRFLRTLAPDMVDLGLRFKGGTCLKKAHFAEYRFSEDLDFTLEEGREIADLEATLDALSAALTEVGFSVGMGEPQRRAGGMTYVATATGPLGRPGRLKVDVTTRELLCFAAVRMPLIDEYSDAAEAALLNCYSVEEIFLEKMICMLDPARIQPRDLFDLDYLADRGGVDVAVALLPFARKAEFKGHYAARLHATVERKSPQLRRMWEQQLAQQLPAGMLPGYNDVERRFMRILRAHRLT
jgi:predicted nucleotidyltransferase component of viral defense system